ncbi:MAG: beta-mannosidase, partial [Paramuribaculum sp.]|nr:beta-mannosidase [Paramuribaculum sp.]
NFWYGPILGAPGKGGHRERRKTELDSLKAMGIDNLRILAGGEGDRSRECHIEPSLQTSPGVYDQDLLEGLDYLLAELERRDMRAVIYLTNSWEWSGGFGTYLEWTGHGESPLPSIDGYTAYVGYVSEFMRDENAKGMFADHVRAIVGRTNSLTGKPYSESPAIMSWQICNEPRCFDKNNKDLFFEWLTSTGRLIKSIDPNHLVSTGSEGMYGCEVDISLWARIHNDDAIDYANIHIWPYNWRWVDADNLTGGLENAFAKTAEYVDAHRKLTDKPLVLEEFGYPRDSMGLTPGSAVSARDAYYRFVASLLTEGKQLNGINFWAWGGYADPLNETWQPGDDFTGDPAQEPQGLYSVFAADSTTTEIIRATTSAIKQKAAERRDH